MNICPNCRRPIYAGQLPGSRHWCDCDTFAQLDHPDTLTVDNDTQPLSLF